MSRRCLAVVVAICWLTPSWAQEQIIGRPPERIDLTPPPPDAAPTVDRSCLRKQEAAIISGEIIVCGERERSDDLPYDREGAENRYAMRTRNEGTLPTPDVAGDGIFRGPATISGVCIPGVFNCPDPPALIIDVTALPQAPPGSDADRISKGLAPLGNNRTNDGAQPTPAQQREELGLPDPAAVSASEAGLVNPSGSAAPEGQR